jgi:sulfur carrier protein ThiS
VSPDSAGKARYAPLPLFLIAAAFIWTAPVFWNRTETQQGSVSAARENSDLYQFVYPTLNYGFARLKEGDLPLWNARQFCGVPFLADHRVGFFSPLNVVFAGLPVGIGMAIHAYVSLFLMGSGFVLFARSLRIGYAATLIGGVVYAYCGASAAVVSRPGMAAALAWAPFMFWAVREYGLRFRLGAAVCAGLTCAMMVLSGAWGVCLVMTALAGAYMTLFVLLPENPKPPGIFSRASGLVVAAAVAIAVSAIQWAPTLVWLHDMGWPDGLLWGTTLAGRVPRGAAELLQQAFSAKAGPLPRIGYVGITTLLLIPAAFFQRKRWRDAVFFWTAAVVLILASLMGQESMPFGFPRPVLFLGASFCIAVLAGLGAGRLLLARRELKDKPVWLPALVVFLLAAAVFFAGVAQVRGYVVAFVCVTAPFLALRTRWAAVLCGMTLALLLFTDLTVASRNSFRHPYQDAPSCYRKYEAAVTAAAEQALGGRVMLSARELDIAMSPNLGMIYPLNMVGGTRIPPAPGLAEWWRRLENKPSASATSLGANLTATAGQPVLLNHMAMRVVLATQGGPLRSETWTTAGPRLRESGKIEDVAVFVNDDALPRAYWVPSCRVASGAAEAADLLASEGFDPSTVCVLDDEPEALASVGALGVAMDGGASAEPPHTRRDATCSVQSLSPEEAVVRVDAPSAGIVLLADAHARGWRVTLNGSPVPLLRVNGVFRGAGVPQGQHELVFTYRPVSVLVGLGVTIGSLLLLLAVGLRTLARGNGG